MNRKQFWTGLLAGISSAPALAKETKPTPAIAEACNGFHSWMQGGPFYLMAASGPDEPLKNPPSALVAVEHCPRGSLRLVSAFRAATGPHLHW